MSEKETWESFLRNLNEKAILKRADARRWVEMENRIEKMDRSDILVIRKLVQKANIQLFRLWETIEMLDSKGIEILPIDFEDLKYECPGMLSKIGEVLKPENVNRENER